jgi:hypothetical protein
MIMHPPSSPLIHNPKKFSALYRTQPSQVLAAPRGQHFPRLFIWNKSSPE